jgi:hypothetical protein
MGPGSRSLRSLVRDDEIDSIFKQPILRPSLRANGSRECAPDDRLREAIHSRSDSENGLLRRFRLSLVELRRTSLASHKVVIPRACGVSSTPRLPDSITDVSEYWIARSSRAMTAGSVARLETVIASHRVGAKRRPMTGSAKQSIAPRKERMDCFVAVLLAMTLNPNMTPHSRGAMRPSFARQCPSIIEGAGNAGCSMHPRPRVRL